MSLLDLSAIDVFEFLPFSHAMKLKAVALYESDESGRLRAVDPASTGRKH